MATNSYDHFHKVRPNWQVDAGYISYEAPALVSGKVITAHGWEYKLSAIILGYGINAAGGSATYTLQKQANSVVYFESQEDVRQYIDPNKNTVHTLNTGDIIYINSYDITVSGNPDDGYTSTQDIWDRLSTWLHDNTAKMYFQITYNNQKTTNTYTIKEGGVIYSLFAATLKCADRQMQDDVKIDVWENCAINYDGQRTYINKNTILNTAGRYENVVATLPCNKKKMVDDVVVAAGNHDAYCSLVGLKFTALQASKANTAERLFDLDRTSKTFNISGIVTAGSDSFTFSRIILGLDIDYKLTINFGDIIWYAASNKLWVNSQNLYTFGTIDIEIKSSTVESTASAAFIDWFMSMQNS